MSASTARISGLSEVEWRHLGAYTSPFSGTGIQFLPLGAEPMIGELVVHEVGYLPRRPHWNYPNVFTPYWRLYYDFRPGHKVVFPHREVPLGPDRFVLIPAHQLFSSVGTEPRPHFWIAFSCSDQPAPDSTIPFIFKPGRTELSLVRDLTRMIDFDREKPDRNRIYRGATALIHLLLGRPEIAWRREPPEALSDVVRYIETHYAEKVYGATLARIARMSESVFRREFRKHHNVSPGRFLAEVRVRQAAHFLCTTSMSAEEVASRCGFSTGAYLSRVFRQTTGQTPAHFRYAVLRSSEGAGGRGSGAGSYHR